MSKCRKNFFKIYLFKLLTVGNDCEMMVSGKRNTNQTKGDERMKIIKEVKRLLEITRGNSSPSEHLKACSELESYDLTKEIQSRYEKMEKLKKEIELLENFKSEERL